MAITNKVLDSAGVGVLWNQIKSEFAERDVKIQALVEGTYDDSALQDRVTAEETARAEAVEALNAKDVELANADTALGNRITALETDKEAYKGYADQAEADAIAEAKAYADGIKTEILGDDLTDTFDTLKAVQDWVDTHGVEATELSTAIANEVTNRETADTQIKDRLDVLEGIEAMTTAELEAIFNPNPVG